MKRARFKLDFEIEAYFTINEDMKVTLFDGSQIILHESKGLNVGTIVFEIDRPDEGIARNEGQQKVNRFFNCMLITKVNLESLKPISFPGKPELLNPEDFKGVPKTGYADMRANAIIVARLELQTLDATNELLAKINKLPQEKQDIISRSLRWFRKASEVDGEDRFIYRWVSFEALLGLIEKRKQTQNLILEFVDRFIETEIARRIFKEHQRTVEGLSDAKLVSWRGVPYSEQLKELLMKESDPRAILPKAAVCIFEVRNRLFHKGEILGLVNGCSSLLRDILRESLRSYVQSEVSYQATTSETDE